MQNIKYKITQKCWMKNLRLIDYKNRLLKSLIGLTNLCDNTLTFPGINDNAKRVKF